MGALQGIVGIVVAVIVLIVFILLMRLIGAWMLRINEVIDELKKMNINLEKIDHLVNNIQQLSNAKEQEEESQE